MNYIDLPKNLSEEIIIKEFGADALRFYKSRLHERKLQGRIYKNPIKTIYIWAYQDRKTHQGFYTTWHGYMRHTKSKNHGRT